MFESLLGRPPRSLEKLLLVLLEKPALGKPTRSFEKLLLLLLLLLLFFERSRLFRYESLMAL